MRRLIYNAEPHHTLNEGEHQVAGGSEFTTTDERADQLLADPIVNVSEAPDSAYVDLTRAELNQLAADSGVEQPERLPNKEAVIAALNNVPSETAQAGGEGPDDQSQEA